MAKRINKIKQIFVLLLFIALLTGCGQFNKSVPSESKEQTQIENAQFIIDEAGVPIMDIEGIGEVRHPAWISIYALQYGGAESFYKPVVDENQTHFENCISWLKENRKTTADGYTVWLYNFDSTYNDVSIKNPWYSAFGQALPIEALVEYYNQYGDTEALSLAREAAEVLFVDINQGGLLFHDGEDYWFEEIPTLQNPSHILNGHMRTLIALYKLYLATGDNVYQQWYECGVDTLKKWLPRYDTGYWFRYDLNPKKDELLFRFNNKYGYDLVDLPIDKIVLSDSLTGANITIDVGNEVDAKEEEPRIAGNGWSAIENLDGRSVRRLLKDNTCDATLQRDGAFHAPYTYFYLDLPSKWEDNLRMDWFELTVIYKDEKQGNMNVQMRSIAPGSTFKDLKDGDLLLTGSGEWREWKIPIRTTDLGWWTGDLYAEKHMQYLEYLSEITPGLKTWTEISKGYFNSVKTSVEYETVIAKKEDLPKQSLLVPVYSLDEAGVMRYHLASEKTEFNDKGEWLAPSVAGLPIYNPYIVASQALQGSSYLSSGYLYDIRQAKGTFDYWDSYDWIYPDELDRIKKEPAFEWLNMHRASINEAYTWYYDFESCYNDVVQEKGWQSAFSQRYIIDAYMSIDDKESALKAAYAYLYETEKGGLSSFNQNGEIWFEEVPNKTHILNAHIASLVALDKVYKAYQDETVNMLYKKGLKSLEENMYRYDTGYWSKYDMNPKKELLFQLDWRKGEASPFVSEITLYNPTSNQATSLDVGSTGAFDAYPNAAGSDWMAPSVEDGISGRQFMNGYAVHPEIVPGGTRHNVYFNAVLPAQGFSEDFCLPAHQLLIRYKDVAPGEFSVKVQSINEGNLLKFNEIPNGIIECIGDNQWKTAVIDIRPNDMGWFMGEDYQVYHNEQLRIVAEQSNRWLLKQYLEKWEYYLQAYQEGNPIIVSDKASREKTDISSQLVHWESSSAYDGFGIENSLDQDPNDDYTAFLETDEDQSFVLGYNETVDLCEIQLVFESIDNYATDYDIIFMCEGEEVSRMKVTSQKQHQQTISFEPIKVDSFQVKVNKLVGQQRLLLRQVKTFGMRAANHSNLKNAGASQKLQTKFEGEMKVSAASDKLDTNKLDEFFSKRTDSLELLPDSWFVLEFYGEIKMEYLEIEFEPGAAPDFLHIYSTDMAGQVNYGTLYENEQNELMDISFKTDKSAAYLCVKLSPGDNPKNSKIILKDIRIYGQKGYSASLDNSDIYMEASDEYNPMKIWKKPLTMGLYAYSEELLAGKTGLTDHEKIMIFMDSMRGFKVGLNESGAETTLKDKLGACGSFTNALVGLAAVQGMEGRVITLANYPVGMGHVVAEIKVNDHWSVYDPTYGAYYTTTPENMKTPYVLSFEELRHGDGKRADVERIVTIPERLTNEAAYGFLGPDIYELANPAGSVDVKNQLFYPLTIDYEGDREITKDEYTTIYQGASYIGAAGKNQSQIWTIDNLEPNKNYVLCVDAEYVGGDRSQDDFVAYALIENGDLLSGEEKNFSNQIGDFEWRIRFTAKEKLVKITLTHDYVGPQYHHVYISRITIEEDRG